MTRKYSCLRMLCIVTATMVFVLVVDFYIHTSLKLQSRKTKTESVGRTVLKAKDKPWLFDQLGEKNIGDVKEDARQAKHHIVFLKVHKSASTSLQTMFFRFGYERNLTFALPVTGNYISKSTRVIEDLIPPRHGDHYDIACNHGCFNFSIYSKLMPKDSTYIAVVRDPFHQFISAVSYYSSVYHFPYLMRVPENKVENLINFPEKYDSVLSYTMNSMARDFGFSTSHYTNSTQAKHYLQHLGEVFDFVLIAEHFDESLIILRRILSWSLKDILYVSKNVRGSETNISKELMEKFKYRNRLDYMVYNFFYKRLEELYTLADEDITRETEQFRRVLTQVQSWCSHPQGVELPVNATLWSHSFSVTRRDCELMSKEEWPFIRLLKDQQGRIL